LIRVKRGFLEQTVEVLAKCFLLEFGDNKEISYGRCKNQKSFNELFEGLNNLELCPDDRADLNQRKGKKYGNHF
jgi:hypothetical protein